MNLVWMLVVPLALAGYGDAVDGHPSRAERELHLWSNAVRMAPEAFQDEYEQRSGCSYDEFLADEKVPKPPLRWNADLARAARAHSWDMWANNWFDHDSSDGTTFADRLARYVDFPVGENIAYGFVSEYRVVTRGFMCSDGHRANLMKSRWDELGTGSIEMRYTQDFGDSGLEPRQLSMGVHVVDGDDAVFYADFYDLAGPPDRLEVVLDGERIALDLAYGVPWAGVYRATTSPGDGCHAYHFEAEVDGVIVRYPEDGAWGWGPCVFDDDDAEWFAARVEPDEPEPTDTGDGEDTGATDTDAPEDTDEPDPDEPTDTSTPEDDDPVAPVEGPTTVGCATAPGSGAWALLAAAALGARRRRGVRGRSILHRR